MLPRSEDLHGQTEGDLLAMHLRAPHRAEEHVIVHSNRIRASSGNVTDAADMSDDRETAMRGR